MEKNLEFLAAKLKQFILFTMMMTTMMFHGVSHGYPMSQAGRLKALLDAKNPSQGLLDDNWMMSISLSGFKAPFDVGKMEDDLIEGGLPGQPSGSSFKQYAGYVNVDESKGRSLFYYFAEAAHNPSSKPLVLWLNGGPGSSSIGVGAMVEIGPFGVNPDGKTLYATKHAWNRVFDGRLLFPLSRKPHLIARDAIFAVSVPSPPFF